MTEQLAPYAASVADYALAGWPCIIPVPPETKTPPPAGFTGADGRDTAEADLVAFLGSHASSSVALRMPDGVIGIDVDEYTKAGVQKHGARTFAEHVARWGPLPLTWTSTARGPGQPSRIHFYRVPVGRYASNLAGGDVEIIQRHHRYAVVAPSFHHDAGAPYAWYDPNGSPSQPSARVPRIDELPWLPELWVAGLAEGASEQGPAAAGYDEGRALLEQLQADDRDQCAEIYSSLTSALDVFNGADAGSRHDTMTGRVHGLVMLAAHGHAGAGSAIQSLAYAWSAKTAGEHREHEFTNMLLTSARKAVTVVGQTQIPHDPCWFGEDYAAYPAPAPQDAEGEAGEPIEPPRWWSTRQLIGTAAFDPRADTDQPLAEAVLRRMFPALRFAYDAKTWLLRGTDAWETRGDLTEWAVAQVAPLMPFGDLTAAKDSDEYGRAKRRSRLLTANSSGAIAKKMKAVVAGGTHPGALRLADLDSDPAILWAGGIAWSLRDSHTQLVSADPSIIDPSTPHLHSAGVTPQLRPTPLWDAMLAAVWPDPEIRAYALRVLSISLTGYADRALPILMGETGRGKTQVVTLLMSVLGSYAHAANPKLLEPRSNEHDTIIYALKGRRLSFIDEGPSEARAGQERLKQLTGGGELTARQMNQDPITFRPSHTLIMTTNDEPVLTDPAVRARTRLIPCEGDPELVRATRAAIGHVSSTAWRSEAPGVLAAMMVEAGRWLADPSTALITAAPDSIAFLAEHLGAEQDPVTRWVTEETEPNDEGTASRELYQAFVASCRRNSMRFDAIPSETKWGRAVTRLGYPPRHTEHGKKRALRLSGSLHAMGPSATWLTPVSSPDGLAAQPVSPQVPVAPPNIAINPANPAIPTNFLTGSLNPDGLLTGWETNPSVAKPQVNRPFSGNPDGLTGLDPSYAHTQARAHAHEARPEIASNPSAQSGSGAANAAPSEPDPKKLAAAEKRAAASAEKRRLALIEASGQMLELPALVQRDGLVYALPLADADKLLELITNDQALTIDVEHTGYPVGHKLHKLKTVQLGNEHYALVLDPHDDDQAAVIRRHLERAPTLHAHSATADLVPTAHAGLLDAGIHHAWARMLDTGVAAKLADPGAEAKLKELAPAVLGAAAVSPAADKGRAALFKAGKWKTDTEHDTPFEESGWAQVDEHAETMIRYAGSDVLDTAAIAARAPWPQGEQLDREKLAQRMTARIAHRGIRIDGAHTAQLRSEQSAELTKWGAVIRAYGAENPGSDQQVAAIAERLGAQLPRTATGKPSVAKGVLEPLRDLEGDLGDFVRARLGYQKAKTRLGLILGPYHQLVTNGDGRARPTVYTLGARTGRMSCAMPNLQQVPREGGFRACLTADPGHVLISADFASVEIRVAAALSQDWALIQMLADGVDLHWEAARQVYGPNATKSNRYDVKRGVFGWLYGGQAPTLAKQMAVSEPTAQLLIDTLANLLPGVTAWREQTREGVKAGQTRFETYAGRVIHMPVRAPHAAPNYCIQGSARELLIDGLIRWNETRWGNAVLLPVHDEIVSMVPEDEAEEATTALTTAMAGQLYGLEIKVEASTPTFAWADAA